MKSRKLVIAILTLLVITMIVYWFTNREIQYKEVAPIPKPSVIEEFDNSSLSSEEIENVTTSIDVQTEADHRDDNLKLLLEPDYGTAEYLDARELAAEKLPDGKVKSLRHRVVKTDYELIDQLLKNSLENSEIAVGPYDLSFFADFPCGVASVSGKELVPGTWSIKGKCSEHPGSILRISVWPYKEEFAVEFSGREKSFLLVNLIHEHSVVIELDTKTFPINND